MKTLRSTIVLLLTLGTIASCGKGDKIEGNPEIFAEANEYHQKSLDLREEILDLEKQVKDSGIDYSELKDQLKTWDKDIIEVPGFEHSHDEHESHQHGESHEGQKERRYHVHNPSKPFSDAEHLDYQKVLHEEMVNIHDKFKRLLSPEVMESDTTSSVNQ
jgi:TolA-binding protein